MKDRIYQNIARLALEPQWEANLNQPHMGSDQKGIVTMQLKESSILLETKSNGFSKEISKAASTI